MTVAENAVDEEIEANSAPADAARYDMARMLAFAFCAADALIETDNGGRILYASGATRHLFGHAPDDMVGMTLRNLSVKEDEAILDALLEQIAIGERFQGVPIKIARGDAPDIVVSLNGYGVPDLSNNCFFTARPVEGGRDVASGGERNAATGMLTANGFGESVKAHLLDASRGGESGELSFIGLSGMSDLVERLEDDEHKGLLRRLGILLKSASLGGDTAAQLGDNRFGLLHSPETDLSIVEGHISEVARSADPKGIGVSVTTQSAGVETLDLSGQDVAQAIVYTIQRVARAGGDITKTLTANLNTDLRDAATKIAQVKLTLETGQFDIAYQAIVSLANRKAHHFEALIRLHDSPVDMNPFEFVCFAEDVGMISEFDLAVCRKVIERLTSAASRGRILPVAVNISGRSIDSEDFIKALRAILEANPQIHGSLMFEITETARIHDLDRANAAIRTLRADGFNVCLDDFGSGESAFEYLRELEVDFVKIDGKYVIDATRSSRDKAFLVAMAGLCRDLGVATIAEFIETEESLAFLKQCGVAYGQGYLFHKPDVAADLSGIDGGKKNVRRKGAVESWG